MFTKIQRISLYIFFFSINFEVWDPLNTGGFFSISKLTGLIYFASIFPNIKKFLRVQSIKPSLNPIWFSFIFLTFISLININIISNSFFDFSIFQNIVLMWILINHERYEKNILQKGLLSFAIGSFILSLFYQMGVGVEYTEGRVSIFGDNENTIGMRMGISAIILIINIIQNPLKLNKSRYALIFSLPLLLKLMADTGSRVAFISFGLMFVTGVFLYNSKKLLYKIAIICSGSFVFILMNKFILQSDIILSRLTKTKENGDLAGRDIIWQKLIPLIKENPIFGVGETGYTQYSHQIFGSFKSPHNVIIEILCYTGIIGLTSYLIFIYGCVKKGIIAYKSMKVLTPILLIIPIIGYIMSGQILTNKICWSIFAFIIASGTFNKYKNISFSSPNIKK